VTSRCKRILFELMDAIDGERLARELSLEKHTERSQRITEAVARRENALRVARQYRRETERGS
jgi:hypothetical protein